MLPIAALIPLVMNLLPFAPKLAKWIGGEKAEAVADKVVGIAQTVTGEMDPAKAVEAIKANAEYQIRFTELANNFELGLEREYTQQMTIINQTMQAEAKSEHWAQWGWRPYWGFISGTAFLAVCIFVCYLGKAAILTKDPNAIAMIPMAVGSFTTLFAVPGAILGITAWGRNKLKSEQVSQCAGQVE